MRANEDGRYSDEFARHAGTDAHNGAFGPQGEALILELQRLRQAFESEERNATPRPKPGRRPPTSAPGRGRRAPSTRSKRRQKSTMGRVIDVCLGPFGFRANSPPEVMTERPGPAADRGPLPQRASASIVPDHPVAMDLSAPGPRIDEPVVAPPAPDVASEPSKSSAPAPPQAPLGRLASVCAAHVKAGAGFLLGRDTLEAQGDAADAALKLQVGGSYREELRTGLRVLLIAVALGGGWLTLMPLAGAVVVPGNLVVQSNVKTIQHPTGGVVAEIKVANGMRVAAGDLLVRLDATQAQASLQMVSKQLDELRARIARLIAERDGLDRLQIAPALAQRSTEDNVRSLLASEEQLFKARFNARKNQKDLLQSRIAQLTEEISGLESQVASKAKQIELISGELTGVQELYDKRLVPLARLTALQRENARIEGERGQLISAIAETKSKIGEAQLQIVRLDQDFRTDVVKELGETQGKEAELVERSVAARDQLDRIEIRAPTSGVVHQLAAHTIGGVIRAGDTIMEIVPDADALLVEARLQPKDIDQVRNGQKAFVRFSAFNQRVTPQLAGEVSFVSADTSRDQQTSAPYFTVRIVLPDEERRRLGGLQLVPGMPAEVFMQTGSRTMMSYLLQPITEQMHRAFVEQ